MKVKTFQKLLGTLTTADKVVFICACLLSGSLYVTFWNEKLPGGIATILVKGAESRHIDLAANKTIQINGPLGDSIITVQNGQARFVSSPCQGKQCIHSGWLKYGGEFSACIPNRVSLYIHNDTPRYDAIIF